MHANCRCRGIVNEGFEQLALALGGVASSYEIPDEAVWDLARAIDVTCQRVQARLAKSDVLTGLDDVPASGAGHPAVAHLLKRLGAGRTDKGERHAG